MTTFTASNGVEIRSRKVVSGFSPLEWRELDSLSDQWFVVGEGIDSGGKATGFSANSRLAQALREYLIAPAERLKPVQEEKEVDRVARVRELTELSWAAPDEEKPWLLAEAQIEATMYAADQARIANLIALPHHFDGEFGPGELEQVRKGLRL